MTGQVSIAMQIGTPFDGAGMLADSLRKNRSLLKRLDVLVPKIRWYKGQLSALAEELQGAPAAQEQLADLWADPRAPETGRRTFLSDRSLMAAPEEIFQGGRFLPFADRKPAWLRRSLGRETQVEMYVSLRIPANQIVDALRHFKSSDLHGLTGGLDPFSIRWSDAVLRLREACPDTPFVLWMKEEQPYIWPQLMHRAAGLYGPVMTDGIADGAARFLRPEIAAHLEAYLKKYDNYEPEFLARAFEHFTRKYAARDQAVEVIEVPGWTAQTVSQLTEAYMADIQEISAISGVTILSA